MIPIPRPTTSKMKRGRKIIKQQMQLSNSESSDSEEEEQQYQKTKRKKLTSSRLTAHLIALLNSSETFQHTKLKLYALLQHHLLLIIILLVFLSSLMYPSLLNWVCLLIDISMAYFHYSGIGKIRFMVLLEELRELMVRDEKTDSSHTNTKGSRE